MPYDDIVKDSSIWRDDYSFREQQSLDNTVRIGIVRSVEFSDINQESTYIVEVQNEGDKHVVPCKVMSRFGGVYNYEEYILQTYNFDKNNDPVGKFDTKAGDQVLVTFLNGDPREGIILGGLNHTAKEAKLKPEDGVQYFRTINGIEHEINNDGEYTLRFRGLPTNSNYLTDKPSDKSIPPAEYDDEVGTTYMKFDIDGGWTLSDNASSDPQSIYVNKSEGTTTITSGAIVLTMKKDGEETSLVTKKLSIAAADEMGTTTKKWSTEASESAKIKSPKIAIGSGGVELLDQLVKLIDAIGAQTIITPVGPASPVQASPQWAQVSQIKSAISGIKGSL